MTKINFKISLITLFCSLALSGQSQTMGLFLNSDKAYNGYTLFSNNEKSYLIDNCGLEVQSWESEFKSGNGIYLMPDGNLLRAGVLFGDFNAGGRSGIFELFNWNGDLLWQYEIADDNKHAHHDLALLPNGNFLCTVWEKKSNDEAKNEGRKFSGEVWSESIWEIEILNNNQANIVWKWSVWDHLIQDFDANKNNFGNIADHPELIDLNYIGPDENTFGDWMHINGLSFNSDLDQIAFSSRNFGEIYVIDHSTSTTQAASHSGGNAGKGGDILFRYGNPKVYGYGSDSDQILRNQHHIDWTPSTSHWPNAFSVYNNDYLDNLRSSVMIFKNPIDEQGQYNFDPINGFGDDAIVYQYNPPSLYSSILSGVQILDNNNLLILEGRSGHIFEINEAEDIVWEYINPVNRNGGPGIQGGTPQFNSLFRAIRYSPDYPGLINQNLTPSIPIELSPNPSDCEIFDMPVSINKHDRQNPSTFNLITNLVQEELVIESNKRGMTKAIIYNLIGQIIKELEIKNGLNNIQINELPTGAYFLVTSNQSEKFIKISK